METSEATESVDRATTPASVAHQSVSHAPSAPLTASDQIPGVSGTDRTSRIRLAALVGIDLTVICAAAFFSGLLYWIVLVEGSSGLSLVQVVDRVNFTAMFVLPLVLIVVASYANGHYTRFSPMWSEMHEFLYTAGIAVAIGAFMLFAAKAHFSRIWLSLFWTMLIVALPLGRLIVKHLLHRRGLWMRPAVILGTGQNALSTKAAIEHDFYAGQRVIKMLPIHNLTTDALAVAVRQLEQVYGDLDIVYAPEGGECYSQIDALLSGPLSLVRSVTVSPPAHGLALYGASSTNVLTHDAVLLRVNTNLRIRWKRVVKRSFDLSIGLVLLVLLAPVLLALAIAVSLDGGPILYRSRRVGHRGCEFGALKFRSMVVDAEDALQQHLAGDLAAREKWRVHFKLEDDPRITAFGRFMRRSSLDELPQLFNVVRGEMSLVGPRPILPEEVSTYGSGLELYCLVPPGLTGLWQVSGRSSLSQERRVELNIWYAKNWSLWIDVVLLLKTLPVLVRGSGAH